MRIAFLLLVTASSSFALGERLLFLPMGDRYANRDVRIESLLDGKSLDHRYTFLGFGFGNAFDAEVTFLEGLGGHGDEGLIDFSYNYIPAVPDFGIGVSIGVQDVMNDAASRSFYVAVSNRTNNYEDFNANTPSELTIGVGTGRYKGLFAGARMPATDTLRFLFEYDSRRITSGVELQPTSGLLLRWAVRGRETLVGATFSKRF
ncbi:MAG: hypothetical protein JNK63_02060 [Chthonomonas sp.]|nr:hypothetical protein [Chthonomonas sp.]